MTARTGTSDSQDGHRSHLGFNGAYNSVCMALGSLVIISGWGTHGGIYTH